VHFGGTEGESAEQRHDHVQNNEHNHENDWCRQLGRPLERPIAHRSQMTQCAMNKRRRFRLSRKLRAASGGVARRFGFHLRDVPTEATLDLLRHRA
jgi:hypothetical protein